jgi:SAM-dependent MidA family methyltransferase
VIDFGSEKHLQDTLHDIDNITCETDSKGIAHFMLPRGCALVIDYGSDNHLQDTLQAVKNHQSVGNVQHVCDMCVTCV